MSHSMALHTLSHSLGTSAGAVLIVNEMNRDSRESEQPHQQWVEDPHQGCRNPAARSHM